MKSPLRPALFLGLLLLIAGAAYVLTQGPPAPVEDPSGPAQEASEIVEEETPAADLATVDSDEGERASIDTVESEPEEVPAWPEEESVWLKGQVALPDGMPGGEELHVLAIDGARTFRGLYDSPSPVDEFWGDGDRERGLLSSARVEEDGSFRIALPPGSTGAHLAATGRFLYSMSTTEVSTATDEVPVLAVRVGMHLSGKLVPPANATGEELELAGIEVEIGPDITGSFDAVAIADIAVSREVEADDEGRFEFRAIPSSMVHGAWVSPEAYARHLELGIQGEEGDSLSVEFPLMRGGRLTGTVRDDAGDPVAGAEVEARMPGALANAVGAMSEAETDAEGRFELAHVPAVELELRATKDGYRRARQKSVEAPAEGGHVDGIELVLGSGSALAGRVVLPGGEAVEGAFVKVAPSLKGIGGAGGMGFDPRDRGNDTSEEDGAFRVTGLGSGSFVVEASWTGDEEQRWTARLDAVTAGTEDVELVLAETKSLRVRAVSQDETPIETYDVTVTLKDSGGMFGLGAERQLEAIHDAEDGIGRIDGLRPGIWTVILDAEGFAASEPVEVTLPQDDPTTIVMLPAASVTGVVLDVDDAPVAGAQVTLELDVASRIEFQMSGGAPSVMTDADGRFELGELSPGSLSLIARREGRAGSEPVPVELVAGQVTENVTLRLRVGGALTGELFGKDGEPDEGKMITVQRVPDYSQQHIGTTDAAGSFQFEHLEPGQWQVVATPNFMTGEMDAGGDAGPGAMAELLGNMKIEMVDIVDGETTHIVMGDAPADPVVVSGRVEHAGEGIEGSIVSFVSEGSGGIAGLKMAATRADGAYEVTLDNPGKYLVTVQSSVGMGRQNSVEFMETIPSGVEDHRLDLSLPEGRISGTVRGPDGEPMAGCRITLTVDGGLPYGSFMGGHYTELVTDKDGAYDIGFIGAGSYSVAAGGPDLGGLFGSAGAAGRSVKSGLRVKEGEWLSGVDFQLEAPGEIGGVVLGADGAPANEATVFVRDEDGRLMERFSLISTDGSGRFSYSGLAPGTYIVSARVEGQASLPSPPVRVVAGETSEVELALERGTMVRVVVTDKTEANVRARISVVDAEGREHSGMMSMQDILNRLDSGFSSEEQSVGPLPPGRYTLTATTDDGRSASKRVNLKGKAERKIKLRLR